MNFRILAIVFVMSGAGAAVAGGGQDPVPEKAGAHPGARPAWAVPVKFAGQPFTSTEEAHHLIYCWLGCLKVKTRGSFFTAGFLNEVTYDQWLPKVSHMREFVCPPDDEWVELSTLKDEKDFQWSDLEKKLLVTFLAEIKDNWLFTDKKTYYQVRIEKYREAFAESEGKNLTPRQMDLVAEMQKWVDAEVARRVTPEMVRDQRLIGRASFLRGFIQDDISQAFSKTYGGPVSEVDMRRCFGGPEGSATKLYFAFEKLKELGAFTFKEPLPPEKVKELSELERLLYEYCWAAYPNNPAFDDLEQRQPGYVKHTPWYQKYQKYCEEERSAKEEAAYIALWNYLTIDLRKITGEPERVPRSRFNWLVWSALAAAAVIAAAIAAAVVWRSRHGKRA